MSGKTLSVEVALGAIDVKFEVPPGVTVLFGPSGAGKSRTLGCIAGILTPERGRIALGDETWFGSVSDRPRSLVPIHRRHVAYVFQSLALFPHLTAAENVAYGIGGTKAEKRARAEAMLAKMHVAALADRKPQTFSGGEAQRVALARAFAMKPSVVLLDEPFSALDHGVRTALLREVGEELAREKVPAILVTHQPEDAQVLGDRVVFIDGGRITRTASMSDRPFPPRGTSPTE